MTPDCKTRRPSTANHPDGSHLRTALDLAEAGVPPLPLRQGKVPFGRCCWCADGACGGRPNTKRAGTCQCPAPCHAWAAATTDTRIINSPTGRGMARGSSGCLPPRRGRSDRRGPRQRGGRRMGSRGTAWPPGSCRRRAVSTGLTRGV